MTMIVQMQRFVGHNSYGTLSQRGGYVGRQNLLDRILTRPLLQQENDEGDYYFG